MNTIYKLSDVVTIIATRSNYNDTVQALLKSYGYAKLAQNGYTNESVNHDEYIHAIRIMQEVEYDVIHAIASVMK